MVRTPIVPCLSDIPGFRLARLALMTAAARGGLHASDGVSKAPSLGVAALIGIACAVISGVVATWWCRRSQSKEGRIPDWSRRGPAPLALFANDIVLLLDNEGAILEANDRATEIYGYTREELLRLNVVDLRHAEEKTTLIRHWNETEERGALRFETVHQRRDGTPVPVEVSSRVIRMDGQTFRQSIIRDITERKKMDETLRSTLRTLEASESRFRKLVEHAPEGIVLESDAVVRYANPVALQLLGVESLSEMVGKSLLTFTHPDHRENALARSRAVAGGVPAPVVERVYVRTDGGFVDLEVSAAPIEFEGRPASLIFLRDIRDRKRSEIEKASLESQLAQAQRLESIGRLAGGVAHDFNNHLTVINGYCELALSQMAGDDPIRESLREIRAAGERASGLTQQLLAFSRKQIVEPKPMSLNEGIQDATKMIGRLIGEDVKMVALLEPSNPVVLADRGQVNQILLNLAVNARDAMPEGGVLTLETGVVEVDAHYAAQHPEAREGSFATLTMTDTGCGMTRDVISHIFEPFYTTKKAGRGTGLGLSTVYGIVHHGGGWIRVYSEPGHGAAFQIYLPRVDVAAQRSAIAEEAESPGGAEAVLVVEDQEDVRRLTTAALRRKGYRVLEARDGREALEKAAGCPHEIDLLLTDVVMPGMNGLELAEKIAERRPAIKVLYTSGYTTEAISAKGVLESGCAYLSKPFTAMQLASKVREALGGGERAAS